MSNLGGTMGYNTKERERRAATHLLINGGTMYASLGNLFEAIPKTNLANHKAKGENRLIEEQKYKI